MRKTGIIIQRVTVKEISWQQTEQLIQQSHKTLIKNYNYRPCTSFAKSNIWNKQLKICTCNEQTFVLITQKNGVIVNFIFRNDFQRNKKNKITFLNLCKDGGKNICFNHTKFQILGYLQIICILFMRYKIRNYFRRFNRGSIRSQILEQSKNSFLRQSFFCIWKT